MNTLKYIHASYSPHWLFRVLAVASFLTLFFASTYVSLALAAKDHEFLLILLLVAFCYGSAFLIPIAIFYLDVFPLIMLGWICRDSADSKLMIDNALSDLSGTWRGDLKNTLPRVEP